MQSSFDVLECVQLPVGIFRFESYAIASAAIGSAVSNPQIKE